MSETYIGMNSAFTATADAIREKSKSTDLITWDEETGFEQAVLAIDGGGLNFEVVGGTVQPENPAENTIWINTDTEITGWTFSFEEPDEPVSGFVWFKIADNSNLITFNALEENEIWIRLDSVFQYVNESFVSQPTKAYQSGVWKDVWNGILYDYGFIPTGYGGLMSGRLNSSYSDGTMEFREDSWYYKCTSKTSIGLKTASKIDVTDFKTLNIIVYGTELRMGLSDSHTPYTDSWVASKALTDNNMAAQSLDISGCNGEYYVLVGTYSGSSNTYSGNIYKFWLE